MEAQPNENAGLGRGVAVGASLLFHGLLAFLLIYGVTLPFESEEPSVVEVTLVQPDELEPPPVEEVEAEPKVLEEEQLPEETEETPEEAQDAEIEPEEPAPEEAADEADEPAAEETAADEPVTNEEPESAAESQLSVLQPVVEFGEEDTAPTEDVQGGTTSEPVPAADQDVADDLPTEGNDTAAGPDEPLEEEVETDPATLQEPLEAPVEPSEEGVDANDSGAFQAELPESEDGDVPAVGELLSSVVPTSKPEAPKSQVTASSASGRVQSQSSGQLTEARQLMSGAVLSDPRARTAMGRMVGSERLNLLCMTELREQLNAASRPPDMLPSFRLQEGAVLQPRRAAFRSLGQWYDVEFRCEADSAIRRVVSFQYRIGAPIPRSEWQSRGFPRF
ncbi:MAG: DUF930 domain-containing protein [Rhodobacteraceae bacterium]|nr:DUF930 domain-containing protein [Paracoccaceae bacterium]